MQTNTYKNRACLFFFAIVAALLPFCARATILQEDFAYPTGAVSGQNGGVGWAAGWSVSGTGYSLVAGAYPLTYSGGGYNIAQTNGAGSFYGGYTGYRGDVRTVAQGLSNVVWFSALMIASNSSSSAFIGVNGTSTTLYNPSTTYSFGISNTTLYASFGGSLNLNVSSTVTNLEADTTHLIVGCILFQTNTVASVQLWADPPDLTHLGQPDIEQTGYSIGSDVFDVEVGGANDGAVSAIRFSDGGGNAAQAYTDVTGATDLTAFPAPPLYTDIVVAEDFAYPTGNLGNLAGGNGWEGPWNVTGSGRTLVAGNSPLTYGGGGYNVAQSSGAGLFYCNYTGYRGGTRSTVSLNNVVWFSALMIVTNNGASVFLGFNSSQTTYYLQSSTYSVGISNSTLYVQYGAGGALRATSVTNLATNSTHLILGCITFQAFGNDDELQVWADPPDLTNLGLPPFQETVYAFGSNLANVEVGGASTSTTAPFGSISALRFSDGGDNPAQAYTDVTGATNTATAPPIVINTQPRSTNVACGSTVAFSVGATGASALQYQWSQNDNLIPNATNSTLTLSDVSALSRGAYVVTISSSAGSLPSGAAALGVTNCNANLLWLGGNGLWDNSSLNWGFVGGAPTNLVAYGDGDSVTFDDTTTSETVTLVGTLAPANVTINGYINSWTFEGTGAIVGSGALTDNNLNNVTWSDTALNTFTGGTYLNLVNYNPAETGLLGIFRIQPGAWPTNLVLNGDELVFQTISGTWPTAISGSNPHSVITTPGAYTGDTLVLSGNISFGGLVAVHGGTMVLTGSNTFTGGVQVGYFGGYESSPTLVIGSARAIGSGPGANNVAVNSGPPGGNGTLDLNGFDQVINGLSTNAGAYPSVFAPGQVINSGSGANTLTLGAGDASATWPGSINGQINVAKIGAGTQTLTGSHTYNNTVISNGTLAVVGGSVTTAQVDVWGGTLAGNGSVNSAPNINIHPGGTLALLPNAISTFQMQTAVNLQGTTQINITKDGGSPQNDQIDASQINLGGQLVVQDIGNTPLAAGDTFTLFNASLSGAFSSVVLPPEATWDTSQLASQGIIIVATVLPVSVVTIYQDNFSYNAALNGQQPDTQGALPWIADPSWSGGAGGASGNSLTSANAFLPFVPQAGYTYTLSATVDCAIYDTNSFMALGFANGTGTGVAWQGTNNPAAWWLAQSDYSGQPDVIYLGPGETTNSFSGSIVPFTPNNYTVILNTRNPLFTASFQVNGTTVAGPVLLGASNLPITTVGFGGYLTNSNTVQSFTLTAQGPAASAPVVLTQPAGGTYLVGSNAVLYAYAGGFPLPSYQWQRDSQNIPGATRAELALDNLSATNSGTYTVLVNNGSGSTASSNAVLTVVTSLPAAPSLAEQIVFNTDNVLSSIPVNTNVDLLETELASVNPAAAGDSFDSAFLYNGTTGTAFENSTNNPGEDAVGGAYTFRFDTSVHTEGYNIASIVTYSGWQDFSASQNYTVYYQQVGSTNFNLLTNVQVLEYGGSLRVALVNPMGGPILSNVTALQFVLPIVPFVSFEPAPTTYAWPATGYVYREVEVDGTPASVVVPQPTLSIAREGDSVVLSWPASATGYGLTSSTRLGAGASWQSLGGTPTVVNGTNEVTISIGGTAQFFRLALP